MPGDADAFPKRQPIYAVRRDWRFGCSGYRQVGTGTTANQMKVHVHETPADIGALLAARIVAGIRAANEAGRAYVLGCPGGRSPMPVYEALAMQLAGAPVDCSRLVIAMMDEYLLAGPDGALAPPPRLGALFLPRLRRARDRRPHQRRSAGSIPRPPREFLDARPVRAREL